jgi:hypothetical protein
MGHITREDRRMAVGFMQKLSTGQAGADDLAELLMIVRTTHPIRCSDKGPWKADSSYRNERWRYFVESNDFTHDVRLYIDGDFADATEFEDYAAWLADKLNSVGAVESDRADEDLSEIVEFLPPPITAAEVKRLREESGEGMMTIKKRLEKERTEIMIAQYTRTPVPALLAHILARMLEDI